MAHATIHFAEEEDAPALLEIYRPYVESTTVSFEYETPSEAEFRARIAGIAAEYPYLVCKLDGQIVGYAYAHRHMERAAYQWNAEASVYLSGSCCGHGLGTMLYRTLLEFLTLQNVKAVFACIAQPNERSMRLHERMGFEPVGCFPNAGYKNGGWHDIAWLRRSLGAYEAQPAPFRPITACDEARIREILCRNAAL